jgi:tetratricopeptide (TPR) repeat protein
VKRIKNRDLYRAFAPAKRRILLKHMLHYASGGIIASLGLALLLYGTSFLIPIEALWQICAVLGIVLFTASWILGWIVRPSDSKIAKAVDKLGLQEKVQTALELEDREDAFALLQRQDAIRSLNGLDRKLISINLPKQHCYIAAALAVSLALVNFIPNPMDAVIKQKQLLKAEIEKQLEELKETAENELADNKMMTEEQQQELAKLVEELAEKLKGTGDYKEALKEISKAEERLAALSDEIREQSLGQLAKQLESSDLTKALAAALNNMDSRDVESAVEQLKQQLENSENAEELSQELKDALSKAAEAMASGELKDSLASIADSLENGSSAAALDELGEVLSNAAGSDNATGDVKYALQQMRNKVAKAAGQSGTEYASSSGTSSSGEAANGDSNGEPGSNNSGNQGQGNQGQSGQGTGQNGQGGQGNQGSGSGQGNQSGQGSSGNSGQAGSGVGDGTTNQSSGRGGSGTAGSQSNQMGNENAQSTYEQIYAPERLGDGGEVSHVQGQQTGSGEVITEDGGRGAGDLSGYIPYKDVYLEYRSEAMSSMDRRVLPPSIREMVRDYFSALGQ